MNVKKQDVLAEYNRATESGKKSLTNLFGEEYFKNENPNSWPGSWEEVCKVKKIDPVKSLPFSNPTNDVEEGVNAFYQVSTIREVLNDGKNADWGNLDELKYYPWFDVIEDNSKPSGFGLSYVDCSYSRTGTTVGSRLTFRKLEGLKHAVKHFMDLYEEVYL